MSKRNKVIAKIYGELKGKEASLKNKIKHEKDEIEISKLTTELYVVQYRIRCGGPNFGLDN